MKNTNTLVKEWGSVEFESSSLKTEQFKKFVSAFKKAMKEVAGDEFTVTGYNVGHFQVSGFLQSKDNPEKFVYFSTPDVRDGRGRSTKILIRTAKYNKDYSGGYNQFVSMMNMADAVRRLA